MGTLTPVLHSYCASPPRRPKSRTLEDEAFDKPSRMVTLGSETFPAEKQKIIISRERPLPSSSRAMTSHLPQRRLGNTCRFSSVNASHTSRTSTCCAEVLTEQREEARHGWSIETIGSLTIRRAAQQNLTSLTNAFDRRAKLH